MTLEILVPSETHGFYDVDLVDVDSERGRMTFLPRHIDCTAELVPGLVRIRTADGEEHYVGTDGGTVVKIGDRVSLSTPRAVVGRALGEIHQELERRRRERARRANDAQQALARLEVQLARSVFEQEPSHG
ncbi:MAG: F0F1 ATP synthase subunit epsilon [Spirochaetota bacterium]